MSGKYVLKSCTFNDWSFIKNLRYCKENIENFVNQEIPTDREQKKYLKKHIDDYWICFIRRRWSNEKGFLDFPVGFIGIIDGDVRLAVHPDHKGKGVGEFMVKSLLEMEEKFSAKVKITNEASLKLFEKCGFKTKYYVLEKDDGNKDT